MAWIERKLPALHKKRLDRAINKLGGNPPSYVVGLWFTAVKALQTRDMYKSLITKFRMTTTTPSTVIDSVKMMGSVEGEGSRSKASLFTEQSSEECFDVLSPTSETSSISTTDPYTSFKNIVQFKRTEKSRHKTVGSAIFEKLSELKMAGVTDYHPFYVVDTGELRRQLSLWKKELPFIKPFYAVKCNPNKSFMKSMLEVEPEMGFDCASLSELDLVLQVSREMGAENSALARNMIYANPIKPVSHLQFANANRVNLTTVDSIEEVEKIAKYTDGLMEVLVRLSTDDSTAVCPLSVKFGADGTYSQEIVDKCIELGVTVRGVAFHVGSGFKDPNTLVKAVLDSRLLIDYINSVQSIQCDILDVGGGFSKESFVPAAEVLRNELMKHFGTEIAGSDFKMISELGRFFSASCFTLVTNVIGTRKEVAIADGPNKARVYLNDGLYGNLNCILYDHQEVEPIVVTSCHDFVMNEHSEVNDESNHNNSTEYSIWGPTCDGLDCIKKKCLLSHDVHTGDYIAFKNAGAYTNAAATAFNGFTNDFEFIFIDSEI